MGELVPLADTTATPGAKREIRHARKFPEFSEIDARMLLADAAAGLSLAQSVKLPGRPPRRVVDIWRQTNPDFDAEMEAAREQRADELADRYLEVTADQQRDPACRRVEGDALKWLASKLSARYANKGAEGMSISQTNISVEGDLNMTPAEAYQRMLGNG